MWFLENYYSFNLQGASDGVASRRKVVKSWNTLVNEDEEKSGYAENGKPDEK